MARTRFALSAILASAALVAGVPANAQQRHYSANSDTAHGPQKLVDKAASVVTELEGDPNARRLLHQAVGLYVIPEYGRAGFIIGGKGGAGVVVARTRTGWSSPAFFNTGGLNVGLQIGAAGGSIVYLLMNHKAVDSFRTHNKVSLSAGAGFSVVKYSDATQASSVKGDAVVWTNIKGAYAGATVDLNDVDLDGKRTREYYGRPVSASAVLSGAVRVPGAAALTRVLPR